MSFFSASWQTSPPEDAAQQQQRASGAVVPAGGGDATSIFSASTAAAQLFQLHLQQPQQQPVTQLPPLPCGPLQLRPRHRRAYSDTWAFLPQCQQPGSHAPELVQASQPTNTLSTIPSAAQCMDIDPTASPAFADPPSLAWAAAGPGAHQQHHQQHHQQQQQRHPLAHSPFPSTDLPLAPPPPPLRPCAAGAPSAGVGAGAGLGSSPGGAGLVARHVRTSSGLEALGEAELLGGEAGVGDPQALPSSNSTPNLKRSPPPALRVNKTAHTKRPSMGSAASGGVRSDADLLMLDPKDVRRILANRQSAAKSKERRMQHAHELENKLAHLQEDMDGMAARMEGMGEDAAVLKQYTAELLRMVPQLQAQLQQLAGTSKALTQELLFAQTNLGLVQSIPDLPPFTHDEALIPLPVLRLPLSRAGAV